MDKGYVQKKPKKKTEYVTTTKETKSDVIKKIIIDRDVVKRYLR